MPLSTYLINGLLGWAIIRGGRLSEAGHFLNFHPSFSNTFQRCKNSVLLTSYRVFTTFVRGWGGGGAAYSRLGACNIFARHGGRLFEVGPYSWLSVYSRWALIRGGPLFEVGPYSWLSAYSRWALIRGGRLFEVDPCSRWALVRGGPLFVVERLFEKI